MRWLDEAASLYEGDFLEGATLPDSQPLAEWADRHAEGRFAELDGRRTHYLDRGSGEPVALVHGFLYDSFTWHNNVDALDFLA